MALIFAVMHLYTFFFFDCFCPFLFHTLKKKSGIDKSVEWSMVSACPSLACFFNRGNTEGTNFSQKNCLMCVYVFCAFVLGQILLFLDNLWCDDLQAG